MLYPRRRKNRARRLMSSALVYLLAVSIVCLQGYDFGRPATVAKTKAVSDHDRAAKPAPPTASTAVPNDARTRTERPERASEQRVSEAYGKLPMSFEASGGRRDGRVKFFARGAGYGLFLTTEEAVLVLRTPNGGGTEAVGRGKAAPSKNRHAAEVLRMKLAGANRRPRVVGVDELPGKSNYFIGNDPAKWRTDVANFGKVRYQNVYPGVDLVFYGSQRQLEYDFVVAPRADAGVIKLDFQGARAKRIEENGDLVLTLGGGEVRSHKPFVYQEQDGRREEVAGRYVLNGKKHVGFELGAYDHSRPLIIDPVLMYSTFLGGLDSDKANDIAVDAQGNVYLTGQTISGDFPVQNAFQGQLAGYSSGNYMADAFVTKLNPAGTALVYSTFLGGHYSSGGFTYGLDTGHGIAVDAAGNAYVTGGTDAHDFPTHNPFRSTWGGGFVTKLSPAGNALVYSSNLSVYEAFAIAVDAAGVAHIAGYSGSAGYQPVNAIQQTSAGGYADIVIAKVSASGSSLLYYTFLGGNGDDRGHDIALDSAGNMYVAGVTSSTNLPVTNAYQSTFSGTGTCGLYPNEHPCNDAFVVKLNPAGSSLLYFTYLGGTSDDRAHAVKVDASGNAFVAGRTSSTNFPTTAGAFQTTFGGENVAANRFGDAFVTKLDAAGNALQYSTYLGGGSHDEATGLAIDSAGNAYVVGTTGSTNFPTANALLSTKGVGANNIYDAFVTKLNSFGSVLTYSTYLGGATWESGNGVAVDASNDAYVVGSTASTDFPVVSAYQPTLGRRFSGDTDAFVAKILSSDGYTISGRITDGGGNSVGGVTMTLVGSRTLTTQTDANGNYSFPYLKPGESCTITPTKNLYIFNPVNRTFSNLTANETADFTATTSATTYTIGGRVNDSGGTGTGGVTVALSGSLSRVTETDSAGNYSFVQLVAGGNYAVTPSKTAYNLTYTFAPPTRSYTSLAANQIADFSFTTSTTLTVNPVADAFVQDGATAGTNYGTVTPLQLRTDRRTDNGLNRDVYLKFDLGSVTRSITAARLRVHAALSEAGSVGTAAYAVADTNWVESGPTGITWSNKPARASTALAGATATITSTTYATYELDVTNYVKAEKLAGRDLVSLALHDPSSVTPNVTLNSREAPTNKPQLYITTSGSNNSAPAVSLNGPANGATYAAPAAVTLDASAADSDGSVTKVDFYAGTMWLGADTASPYSLSYTFEAGSYALSAVATDNSGATASSSVVNITVNAPNNLPAVSLTAPAAGTVFPAGATINVSANATDTDGTITKVDFYAGTSLVGTATAAPYQIAWANATPGAHTLTAKATDNAGAVVTSSPVAINVVWQTGLSPTADAYVKDGTSATTNFGTVVELQTQQLTGSNRESYLKFDLAPLGAAGNVTNAKLRLYGRLSDAAAVNVPAAVYAASPTTWIESGSGSITWNTKPTAGGAALATTTITNNVARWYEWDVTSHVQGAGAGLVSLALKHTGASANYATFHSKEATTNRPQLIITTRAAPRGVLFVTGSSTLNAAEALIKTRLEGLGFVVTVKAAGTNNNAVNTTEAYGKAAVVISSTVTPANVLEKFRHVAVPVVSWEFDLLDNFGMTDTTAGNFGVDTGQSSLVITNPSHPLAAGLSSTVSAASPAGSFTWGKPNANAAKAATLTGDATKVALFGYESGAAMPGLAAPARRVSLFLTDLTASSLTPQGWSLFDAAVKWATETPVAPTLTGLTPANGPTGTVVTLSGYNFGETQGTSTLTFNGVAASASAWGRASIVAAVPAGATTGLVVVTVNGLPSNGIVFTVESPPADTDGDGLPDAWEMQHFGNLAQTAGGDPDGDGLTNLQEYQQGRNPTKPAQADDGTGVNLKVHTPLAPPGQ